MKLDISGHSALFSHGPVAAGEFVLDDPFKPYLHPLRTPAGHVVTDSMPVDHRHHKGLMFALRCDDLNFWEENPGATNCGVQKILSARKADGALALDLLWCREDGGMETYREQRRISCELDSQGGFVWTWYSRRETLRDHRLIQSEWSYKLPDGRKINYHGLGIRLPWAWAWPDPEVCGVKIGDEPQDPAKACGTNGPSVTWWGKIDGHWNPPRASVTLEQDHDYGWFVLKGEFAYLAVGPSNYTDIDVYRRQIFEETYHIHVRNLK